MMVVATIAMAIRQGNSFVVAPMLRGIQRTGATGAFSIIQKYIELACPGSFFKLNVDKRHNQATELRASVVCPNAQHPSDSMASKQTPTSVETIPTSAGLALRTHRHLGLLMCQFCDFDFLHQQFPMFCVCSLRWPRTTKKRAVQNVQRCHAREFQSACVGRRDGRAQGGALVGVTGCREA